MGNYSPQQQAQAAAAAAIAQTWKCAVHATPCYITSAGEHVQIHALRLKQWAAAVVRQSHHLRFCIGKLTLHHQVAGTASVENPPPSELLELWTGKTGSSPQVKSRGRTGPHPASPAVPGPDSILTQFLTAVVPAVVPLMHAAIDRSSSSSSSIRSLTPSASLSVSRPMLSGAHTASSPPPEVEEELVRCLEAFGRERKVAIQLIDDAIGVLSDELFTPDSLTEVSIERLCELLPNFAEGQLYSLKSFTGHWFDKVTSKRAHHF